MGSAAAVRSRPDYRGGFEGRWGRRARPLGPLPGDAAVWRSLRSIQRGDDWREPAAAEELRGLTGRSSQALLATFGQVFRAGVAHGAPELVALSCELLPLVTEARLRRAGSVDDYERACRLLGEAGGASTFAPARLRRSVATQSAGCPASEETMRTAWRALRAGERQRGRRLVAAALRQASGCPAGRPLRRTPVGPQEPGFVLVCILQVLDAPARTYLAGEPVRPAVDRAVDQDFARNVRLLASSGW